MKTVLAAHLAAAVVLAAAAPAAAVGGGFLGSSNAAGQASVQLPGATEAAVAATAPHELGAAAARLGRADGASQGVRSSASAVNVTSAGQRLRSASAGQLAAQRDSATLGLGRQETLCKLKSLVRVHNVVAYAETYRRIRRFYGTCAVVSSSGVLLGQRHGAAIDAADLVIRFNAAPIAQFESMVGSKEELRVVNQQFPGLALDGQLGSYTLREQATLIVIPMEPPPRLWQFHRAHPRLELYELEPEAHRSLSLALQALYPASWFSAGRHAGVSLIPSSGAMGMVLALHLCREVRAYGFAATPQAQRYPYNYFEHQVADDNASDSLWHRTFDAEKDLWRRLAANSAADVDASDVAVMPGFPAADCPA